MNDDGVDRAAHSRLAARLVLREECRRARHTGAGRGHPNFCLGFTSGILPMWTGPTLVLEVSEAGSPFGGLARSTAAENQSSAFRPPTSMGMEKTLSLWEMLGMQITLVPTVSTIQPSEA